MDIPACPVCKSSLYQDKIPVLGAIIVCDHCSSFYQVVNSSPLSLQLLGSTNELDDAQQSEQGDRLL